MLWFLLEGEDREGLINGVGCGGKVERKNSKETKPGDIRSGYEI